MRSVRVVAIAVVGALLAIAANADDESAPGPRSLERKIDDADCVVVARLRTTPALVGDEFMADVDEVLKGKPVEGPLRVRSAYPIGTRLPIPADVPRPPATEGLADGDKLTLFLDAPADGLRQSRDPILLRPTERVSSWRLPGLRATWTRETVRALARLDAEEDASKAVDLWIEGLGDPLSPTKANPLLQQCLLIRLTSAVDGAKSPLGERLGARAAREFASARKRILEAIKGWASSADRTMTYLVVHVGRACLPPRDEEERAVLAHYVMCALDSRGKDAVEGLHLAFELDAADFCEFGLRMLLGEPATKTDVVEEIADAARDYVRAHPERETLVVESVLPLLAEERASSANLVVQRVTGEKPKTADEWRAWLKARQSAKK